MSDSEKQLSLGATNTVVTAFKELVNAGLGLVDAASKSVYTAKSAVTDMKATADSDKSTLDKTTSIANQTADTAGELINNFESVKTTFDSILYDNALKLPEANNVSFDFITDITKNLVEFTGSNVYKSFNGDIDTSFKKPDGKMIGWLTTDPASQYALLLCNAEQYVVSLNDVTPIPIIEDFDVLYKQLLKAKFKDPNFYIDTVKTVTSLVTSFRDYTSDETVNGQSNKYVTAAKETAKSMSDFANKTDAGKSAELPVDSQEGFDFDDEELEWQSEEYKNQEIADSIEAQANEDYLDEVVNHVNAIIYDMPDSNAHSCRDARNIIYCYQLPDSISYTSSAQYDNVATRGTQQPFQFYNCANQITLSFELNWHIDELRDNATRSSISTMKTLQSIAKAAEGFTRPWASGNSIKPKICKVILPSLAEIGYITDAQISYSGAITSAEDPYFSGESKEHGSFTTTEVYKYKNETTKDKVITDFCYSQLKINFTLLIVKDILLSSSKGKSSKDSASKESDKKSAVDVVASKTASKVDKDALKKQTDAAISIKALPESAAGVVATLAHNVNSYFDK